jgi:hypothetical protein
MTVIRRAFDALGANASIITKELRRGWCSARATNDVRTLRKWPQIRGLRACIPGRAPPR